VTGWSSASGATLAGLAGGEGAEAEEGAAGAGVAAAAGRSGAAAAWWPAPEVIVSPMPSPVMASTPAAVATPDRKLSSSIRA
jgi:hypothetical protein